MKKLVEEYQCPGCVCGSDIECGKYKVSETLACDGHVAGTRVIPIVGRIFLGMPKGFSRMGPDEKLRVWIYKNTTDFKFNNLNIPVWKYKNKKGHIFVRGLMPRVNTTFLMVFESGNFEKIDAYCITDEFIKTID